MFDNSKNSLKISLVYVSLIIGAGFASGKEIMYYFLKYKKLGFLGIAVASFIFGFICFVILDICHKKRIKNYDEFINTVVGKKLGYFLEITIIFFMFIFFSTMLSAGSIAINQAFNLNYTLSVIIISFLCFIVFLIGVEGILIVSNIVTPIMIIGSIFISLYIFFKETDFVFSNTNNILLFVKNNWVFSSFIYVSYNIVTAISILASMGEYILSCKVSKLTGILSGSLIFILGIFISLPVFLYYYEVINCEIPMLKIVHKYNIKIEYFYLLILISAIFTTAISNGFGVINWLTLKINCNKNILRLIVTLLGILFSYIGFSNFVGKIYPLFAFIGIIEIAIILKYFLKNVVKQ